MRDETVTEIEVNDDEQRKELLSFLALMKHTPELSLCVKGTDIALPASLVASIMVVAQTLSEGGAIALVREEREVSPAEAARLLGVSRQYVDRLLANDVLPSRRLPDSTYRRIPVSAVLEHRRKKERNREGLRRIHEHSEGLPA